MFKSLFQVWLLFGKQICVWQSSVKMMCLNVPWGAFDSVQESPIHKTYSVFLVNNCFQLSRNFEKKMVYGICEVLKSTQKEI